MLEKHLRDYSCMTKGDVFQFTYANKKYAFNVLEVRPGGVFGGEKRKVVLPRPLLI